MSDLVERLYRLPASFISRPFRLHIQRMFDPIMHTNKIFFANNDVSLHPSFRLSLSDLQHLNVIQPIFLSLILFFVCDYVRLLEMVVLSKISTYLLSLFCQGARITKASHFDYEYVLGHKIVFICVATGKPRPKIIWFKDGRELYDHHYLHVSTLHNYAYKQLENHILILI